MAVRFATDTSGWRDRIRVYRANVTADFAEIVTGVSRDRDRVRDEGCVDREDSLAALF